MKILAISDDRPGIELLEHHCRAILAAKLEQFTALDSSAKVSAQLDQGIFDLVLLDLMDPGGEGLPLPGAPGAPRLPTIICSARIDLAIRAFELGAIDFVPKPVTRERLAKALARAAPPANRPASDDRFIAVRRHGRIDLVPVEQLLYVEGSDKYSELVLANGQRNFYDKCLGRVEASLPPAFVRIHKSFLVRLTMVSRLIVQRGSRYYAELKTGQRLPVGRSRYAQVKSRLI